MSYWRDREKLMYYALVRRWLEELGPLESILDVGCFDTPVVTWGSFRQRFTVDPRSRPALIGVRQVVGSWPDCAGLVPRCDVVTCLQVLEHLDEPGPFCAALFGHARHAVLLSVPWLWPAGMEPYHRQDPVDAEKLRGWTGREPDQQEVVGTPARAVAVYLHSHRSATTSASDGSRRRPTLFSAEPAA